MAQYLARSVIRKKSFWVALPLIVVLSLVLAACGGGTTSTPTTTTVTITEVPQSATVTADTYSFSPESVNIKKGDTVKWDNKSDENHLLQLTGPGTNPFTAQSIVPTSRGGGTVTSYEMKFDEAGTYEYTSKLVKRATDGQHEGEPLSQAKGTIVVQ